MASADFIFTCWKKEQSSFNKKLSALRKHPGKNAVHDLRVAVKKLRAALELYFLLSEKPLPEEPLKETEQLFSILGKQRDLEICLEIIDSFEKGTGKKYPEMKNYFRSVLPVAYEWTKRASRQYKKKELSAIAGLLKTGRKLIEQEELKLKIAGIINDHLSNGRIFYKKPHRLRQYLKKIYYWIKMVPGPLLINVNYEKELQGLLEDFGNWQNLAVFEMKLRHFRKDYLPKTFPEYEAVKMLEAGVQEKKEKLLKKALSRTRGLLRKAMPKEKPRP